jgi:hypothetical protein
MALLLMAAGASLSSLPWTYDWGRFPAAWFGANGTDWEAVGALDNYSLAVLGWQHMTLATNWSGPIYAQLAQTAALKAAHPGLPVLAYACFGCANGFNPATASIMRDPAYRDFFMQSTDGPEYTFGACQNMGVHRHTLAHPCVGFFWNFANASARAFYLARVLGPLIAAPASVIDGVFLDAVDWAYTTPEWRPWGRDVVNVPNCSASGGCEALIEGTLDVLRRACVALNAVHKVPMLANPAYFRDIGNKKIWLDERRLLDALAGLDFMRYYEFVRAESALSSGLLPNMLEESRRGVPVGAHTYFKNATEDPTAHMAAFLLGREDGWYFFGSTGWFDRDFAWSAEYDRAAVCGRPLGPASGGPLHFARNFTGCTVRLECTNGSAAMRGAAEDQAVGDCVGAIELVV